MGVSLTEIVSGREIELDQLTGKKLAVDAFNTLYQFLSIIRDRTTGQPLRDSKGRVTSHLSGLFYRTIKVMENGATPIYVFDGEPPEFKKTTVEKRDERREKARERWKKALEKGEKEKARKAAQASSKLSDEMIEESKKLLGKMGVSFVQAPSEGEAQAARMVKEGKVYASASQDWDSLLFGSPVMVKNLTITGRRKLPNKEKYIEIKPEVIKLESVLEELEINQDQLILLGILVGTDYNPGGIKGIGPKTALEKVKKKPTLEELLEEIDWDFDAPAEEIFQFFKHPPTEEVKIEKQELDTEAIREMMVGEHNFSEKRIGKALDRLRAVKEGGKQTGLDRFA